MALKFGQSQQQRLTPEQVLDLRDKFYKGLWSYTDLMNLEHINVSKNVMIDAIKGNRGYAKIKDEIPQELKDKRVPARTMYPMPSRDLERRLRAQIKWPEPTYHSEPSKSFEELMK